MLKRKGEEWQRYSALAWVTWGADTSLGPQYSWGPRLDWGGAEGAGRMCQQRSPHELEVPGPQGCMGPQIQVGPP